jgi:hypothetical protein
MIKVPVSPAVSSSMEVKLGSGGSDTGVSHPDASSNSAAMTTVGRPELLLENPLRMVGN